MRPPLHAPHLNLTFNSKQTTRFCSKAKISCISHHRRRRPPSRIFFFCDCITTRSPSPYFSPKYAVSIFSCTNAFLTALFHVSVQFSSGLTDLQNAFGTIFVSYLVHDCNMQRAYGARLFILFILPLGRVNIELYFGREKRKTLTWLHLEYFKNIQNKR